jgi:hypothetical protein
MSLLTEFIKHDHPRGGQAGFYNQKTDGKITMLFMGSYKSIVKPGFPYFHGICPTKNPLVICYIANWKDPPFSSWVNQLFQLGHFQ